MANKLRFTFSILVLFVSMLSNLAEAGEAGSYYDVDRPGEGIVVQLSGNKVLFYFFTYRDTGEQLWLVGNAELTDPETRGYAYFTEAFNYPATDPETGILCDVKIAGVFYLKPTALGWQLSFLPFLLTQQLPNTASLFDGPFVFETLLFKSD